FCKFSIHFYYSMRSKRKKPHGALSAPFTTRPRKSCTVLMRRAGGTFHNAKPSRKARSFMLY
ncbi:hypothetical protein, partial [Ruthenibacterium lactatiformans]|uniref:hypothetical protein n=1 Tax=Ruthenibacterium lactatiformans TaxID=1550024 RepID=UPI003AB996C1